METSKAALLTSASFACIRRLDECLGLLEMLLFGVSDLLPRDPRRSLDLLRPCASLFFISFGFAARDLPAARVPLFEVLRAREQLLLGDSLRAALRD